ncbi:hypothetical protein BZM26_00050 [Paraburkholderia strydomiana]|nr:hypothetical protein BZM26_00050 [Paraburkholderia strydomiana]
MLAVVERLTTAVLAYRVVYSSEVSASDVAALIRDAICKIWQPKVLTSPGIEYLPAGGLPSGVIPEARHAVWNVTLLDGALANLATRIHDDVRKSTGFVVIWGPRDISNTGRMLSTRSLELHRTYSINYPQPLDRILIPGVPRTPRRLQKIQDSC